MTKNGQTDAPRHPGTGSGPTSDVVGGERHLLTALCYDVVGSTDLLTHSDPEDFHEVMSEFQQTARQAISARGGWVRDELGDGGLALFPLEIDAKDAAAAAINAGLEVIESCKNVGINQGFPPLRIRVGVATSMARIGRGETAGAISNVTGLSLVLASRLQAMAEPNTVLVSQQTRSLARRSHRFSFLSLQPLKGVPEPESIWRVLGRKNDFDRYLAFGRVNSPMVNRVADLNEISNCWRNAVVGKGALVLIEGEAGIGKSRMLHEIRRLTRAERRKILLFQCLPGGSRSPLGPIKLAATPAGVARIGSITRADLMERLRQLGIHNEEAVEIFSFLLGTNGTTGEKLREVSVEAIQAKLMDAVQRSAQEICAAGPVLVTVEDIHWIDPTSRQMLLALSRAINKLPMLLIATTRGSTGNNLAAQSNIRHLILSRLSGEETREITEARMLKKHVPGVPGFLELVERICGGVPLLVEEVCEWAAANPTSVANRFMASTKPGDASILEFVLDARLETLGQARDVVRAAAVAGVRFSRPLVQKILPELAENVLEEALVALVDAGLIVRMRSLDELSFGFRHASIQETIYTASFRKTRQVFHRRLVEAVREDRAIAAWIDDATLAEHAERAGLPETAIELLIAAGKENSARSLMTEARQLLEHGLSLIERLPASDRRDQLQLSVLAALGPILTATEGPASTAARKLYEDGVALARRRPAGEKAIWFPMYWGWWFTGTDIENRRAREILHELRDVADPEVQLQIRHCIWAIDFYLGRHDSCLTAIDSGLPLYDPGRGRMSRILFGGHDAKVCGLSHKSLSLWLTGKAASAVRTMVEARQYAQQTEHIGSMVHAYLNEAMLHCYRRDFARLRSAAAEIRQLAETNGLRSLAATAEIFDGWCMGIEHSPEEGQEMIRRGLAIHAELQTPEDYVVYCDMLAELMGLTGNYDQGLGLIASAIEKAEDSEYRYWLSALYHRRALLLEGRHSIPSDIEDALAKSLDIATVQGAVTLLLLAHETARQSSPSLALRYNQSAELAHSEFEREEPLFVSPPRGNLPGPTSSLL